MKNKLVLSDNFKVLKAIPDNSIDLIYLDPPFNTGKKRRYKRISTNRDDKGTRIGFGGQKYNETERSVHAFADEFADYLLFWEPRLVHCYRILKPTGSLFMHLDYREVHRCKIMLDAIFGDACFQNEIIWVYDWGGRSKKRWAAKHDNILWYSKDPDDYTFNYSEIDRVPYLAPGLQTPDRVKLGKPVTDSWWMSVIGTNAKERLGYPAQKPLKLLERIVRAHSKPGEIVLDPVCGVGTTGEAAGNLGRSFILIDNHAAAILLSYERLKKFNLKCIGFATP